MNLTYILIFFFYSKRRNYYIIIKIFGRKWVAVNPYISVLQTSIFTCMPTRI